MELQLELKKHGRHCGAVVDRRPPRQEHFRAAVRPKETRQVRVSADDRSAVARPVHVLLPGSSVAPPLPDPSVRFRARAHARRARRCPERAVRPLLLAVARSVVRARRLARREGDSVSHRGAETAAAQPQRHQHAERHRPPLPARVKPASVGLVWHVRERRLDRPGSAGRQRRLVLLRVRPRIARDSPVGRRRQAPLLARAVRCCDGRCALARGQPERSQELLRERSHPSFLVPAPR